jgi:hypothetical protein
MATTAPLPLFEAIRRRWERRFAGFTSKGFALVLLLCVLNAVRRKIPDLIDGKEAITAGLADVAQLTVLGLGVALPIALAVVATCNAVPVQPSRRYPALALAVALSSLLAVAAMQLLEHWWFGGVMLRLDQPLLALADFVRVWLRYCMLAALFTSVYVYARTADESVGRAREAEVDRERLFAQMEEARLQVLQAQIEPHFLFNTLATVRRLYHTTPASAVTMLDNLMRYLSVALPQMRASESTLGREAALADAYLGIQKLRMGRRLTFEIDVPVALQDLAVPSMMLLTLVENAIKHGVSPLPEGGFIRVGAAREGDRLSIIVADSGQGFVHTSGTGTGLANIRARLAALHSAAARLELSANLPRGITATLSLPLEASGLERR